MPYTKVPVTLSGCLTDVCKSVILTRVSLKDLHEHTAKASMSCDAVESAVKKLLIRVSWLVLDLSSASYLVYQSGNNLDLNFSPPLLSFVQTYYVLLDSNTWKA